MRAIYLTSQFKSDEEINLPCIERPIPNLKPGEALIQIVSSGVNPSDARATMGYFSHAKLPRIPGRDYAGIVVEGSPKWKGKHIWGTGGKTGIETDGTHAEYAAIPEEGLAEIPKTLSLLKAGAQTLPYITAYYGLATRSRIEPGQKVLVIGALGQVGRAAMSICFWKACKPFALVRTEKDVETARKLGWEAFTEIPKNSSFDLILNSIGALHWEQQMNALKKNGSMVVIAALPGNREVQLNLFEFYQKNQQIFGINTLDLDHALNAILLNEMKEGFESGALIPLEPEVFSLEKATEAYQKVIRGSSGKRIVLLPSGLVITK